MGKSCVRFKKIEDIPLEVIGRAIKRVPVKKFIAYYEAAVKPSGGKRKSARKSSAPKRGVATKKTKG